MTPDLNHSIEEHNRLMRVWWKIPEYVNERKAFVRRHPFCARCGRPAQTPGHAHEDYTKGYQGYLNAVKNDKCVPLCNSCNLNERLGKKPCPICVSERLDRIRYIPQSEETCFNHLPEEEKHRVWTIQRIRKKAKCTHLCSWNRGNQHCFSPLRYSRVCDRSSKKAEGCDHYLEKVKI